MKKLQNLAEYRMLYSKINFVYRKGGYARNDQEKAMVQEILDHPLIKGKNTALSKTAAASCYYIQGLCSLVQYKYEESFEKFNKVVHIFEENPHLIIEIPKHYIRALNNLLFCLLDKEDYKSLFELIEKIRNLENTPGFASTDLKMKIFSSTYNAELIAYDKMGDYVKAVEIVDNILNGIENFGQQISKEEEIVFYYNIAYSYFGTDRWKDSLKWINKMLNDNEQQLRQDIFSFSRLFSLIIHFELEHYDLLEYMLKSTGRFYQKRKNEIGREFKVESLFLKYMKKLAKAANNKDKTFDLLTNLKEEMAIVLVEPYEKVALSYFDFVGWIDAKLNNQTFGEYKKQHLIKR
jgi:tetratricopeptide (TPR) repeat protein